MTRALYELANAIASLSAIAGIGAACIWIGG